MVLTDLQAAMKYLLPLLLISTPALANAPQFTTGTMTQTVTATQTVSETIAIERFGSEVKTWNIEAIDSNGASIDIIDTNTEFHIVDPAQPWQLEINTRAAGLVETEDITRTINTTTTTNTLSVFAQ